MMRVHGEAVQQAVAEVIQSGRFIGGPLVGELEKRLAHEVGVSSAIACGSGTVAEQLLLMALNIGPGDEVLVPDFTFAATAEAVLLVGATPVCVDVDLETFTMDPAAARAAMGPQVKAIVPVSLFGYPVDVSAFEALAAEYGVALIEDACQSLGAKREGRNSGAFGTAAFTSFYPSKPLGGIGDGGMVFTSDDALGQLVRRLRHHGEVGHHLHQELGTNSRLDAIQAAALLAKVDAFPGEVRMRGEAAARYDAAFSGLSGSLVKPMIHPDTVSSYAQYTVRVSDATARGELVAYLQGVEVPTAIHYPQPLHKQPFLKGRLKRQLPTPVTEELCQQVVSLPLSAYMSAEDQERVISGVYAWTQLATTAAAGGRR